MFLIGVLDIHIFEIVIEPTTKYQSRSDQDYKLKILHSFPWVRNSKKGEIRGIRVLPSRRKEERKLNEEKEVLEKLVNAGLIEWLKKN
jgi:hypothetical protein